MFKPDWQIRDCFYKGGKYDVIYDASSRYRWFYSRYFDDVKRYRLANDPRYLFIDKNQIALRKRS